MGRGYSFQSFFLYIDFKTKRYYTFQRERERRELFINLSESSVWGHIRTPDSQYVKMRKKNTCIKRAIYFQPKSCVDINIFWIKNRTFNECFIGDISE